MSTEPSSFPPLQQQQPRQPDTTPVVDRDGDSDSDDDLRLFAAVQETIQLDKIPDFVSTVLRRLRQSDSDLDLQKSEVDQLVTIDSPLFGSYHILYPLRFSDGTRWLLKIPANGTPGRFNEAAARSLSSEALTMQLLRRETTIPIPDVFAFDASVENELGCPFILLSFVHGRPLYECWFDRTVSKDVVRARRAQTLQDLAAAMVQLGRFSFDQGGSILFDEQGQPASIGSVRLDDHEAVLKRSQTDDPDESAIYMEMGPFDEPRDFYISVLERRHEPSSDFARGKLKLLRMFLEWIPEPQDGQKKFVLTHPDLGFQNLIVSDDGHLQGLIDWDGVSAVPRSLGNEKYPSWLTRDWDPAMYRYETEMDEGVEPKGLWEDSPQRLAFDRATYARMMESCLCHERTLRSGAENTSGTEQVSLNSTVSLTRRSLITENLYIAAVSPISTAGIMEKVFDEIVRAIGKGSSTSILADSEAEEPGAWGNDNEDEPELTEPDDFYLSDVAHALADGELDDRRLGYLKTGFAKLLEHV
ncbi:MAG: hypothetical protein M4579_005806 [Chaenotheca gracillima]|nr:MAG: hypothetical protein M4579_005806 [Chaenotheca gracillima]